MDTLQTRLKQILTSHGHSLTQPRRLILDIFLQAREPLSLPEVIATAKDQVDRATVYRTLDLFIKTGIVDRLPAGFKYRYELGSEFRSHHHHLTCVSCSSAVSFEDDSIERSLRSVAALHGYSIQAHQLEVQGLCGNCRHAKNGGVNGIL